MTSSQLTKDGILDALGPLAEPETGKPLVAQGQIRDVKVTGNDVSLVAAITSHDAPLRGEISAQIGEVIRAAYPNLGKLNVQFAEQQRPAVPLGQLGLTAKSVIAVGSGKGGVGKSTVAANLAFGLQRAGAKVGLMDADVYGPSIPHLLGLEGRPEIVDNKLRPMYRDGIPVMSMGFLVPASEAVVWRGPMLHGAITQFLRDTAWGDLDYLIIDMPPGTGDIALTLSQALPLTGAVVVCTPQDVALLDAVKAIAMFRKVNIRVLGMVENMSGFVCPDCGKRYDIFGSGGAKKRAAELNIPFLGEVPINIAMRVHGDEGKTAANYSDEQIRPYLERLVQELARNVAEAKRAGAMMASLPEL